MIQLVRMELNELKQKILPVLKPYGVTRAGLFGSAARGEDTSDSDIDLLVEITKPISLLGFVHLEHKLEEVLGKKVDLVEYDAIKPLLKKYILKDHIPLL